MANQTKRSITIFWPLLVLYIGIILVANKQDISGDEQRYLTYAQNLSQGYYTDEDEPMFRNGPGYPLLITPFIAANANPAIPRLLNAFMLFGAVLFFYLFIQEITARKTASILAFVFGLYYPIHRWLPYLMSEILVVFLLCGFLYLATRALKKVQYRLKDLLLPGFFLGLLILTKFIFGYVVLCFTILAVVSFIFVRNLKALKLLSIGGLSFLVIIPYMIYTYQLTNRPFYMGTNGGEQFYWMSSRLENEHGNWFSHRSVLSWENQLMDSSHYQFYLKVKDLDPIPQNEAFKKKGLEQIKSHPKDYAMNVFSNTLRIFFGYPNSYTYQNYTIFFYLLIQIIPIALLMMSVIPLWYNWRQLPFEVVMWSLFGLIYLGGTVLLTGTPRHFIPFVPLLLMYLGYVYSNFVKVTIQGVKL